MVNGCINGVLDETKYSSPVPMVGLYITAGSVVCMLLMLFDIISAFRHKKVRWMPCRLFSLNSLTLTLLSICSKIPLDLTTPMPGVYDQLAKLTGTTIICVSMGFFCPSLGDQSDSEILTNIIALAILIITVVVNICIQISTGVIYLFIKEHIILMGCMCVLLHLLWGLSRDINKGNDIYLDFRKSLMVKGQGSLLQRLKLCYIYGFNTNPQVRASRASTHDYIVICCLTSFGVLVQAAVRSLIMKQHKSCRGNSDYDWSMWMIVMFQILAILLGIFAISFRWFNFLHEHEDLNNKGYKYEDFIIDGNPILGANSWNTFCSHFQAFVTTILYSPLMAVWVLLYHLTLFCRCCLCCCRWVCCTFCSDTQDENAILTEYKDLVDGDGRQMKKWIVHKALNDMNRWMDGSRKRSVENLSKILSRTDPSLELCTNRTLKDLYPDEMGLEVSSLPMVLLVKIAEILLPSNLSKALEYSFGEAYEIVDFVETRINLTTFKTKMKKKLTKAVVLGDGFGDLLPKIIEKYGIEFQSQSELNRARIILRELKSTLPPDFLAKEVGVITDVIIRQDHQTVHDLYAYMEQMFVDMLHLFLVQFPIVIYKEVTESSGEEFEKRVACALKLLWKIEALENQVAWLFPNVGGFSSLITPTVPASLTDPSDDFSSVGIDIPLTLEGIVIQAPETQTISS
ncbi:hypothetical protein ACHQM5_017554 [Ranunculus cassubicifolius]